jgi:transcriptional regulator with XRE-family HTH domain
VGESDFAWQSLRAHTVEVWAFRQNEAAVASLSNRNLDEIREILSDLEELQDSLPKRFNRPLFRRVRRLTGTQAEWAELANVTQTTIGNWERGYTAPNRYYRASLFRACEALKAKLSETPSGSQFELGRRIDPVRTSRNLDRSILRAALTDFDYDSASRKIVPIPFSGDFDEELAAEIAEDRSNLLASLKQQAGFIADSISENANLKDRLNYRFGFADFQAEAV